MSEKGRPHGIPSMIGGPSQRVVQMGSRCQSRIIRLRSGDLGSPVTRGAPKFSTEKWRNGLGAARRSTVLKAIGIDIERAAAEVEERWPRPIEHSSKCRFISMDRWHATEQRTPAKTVDAF